MKTLITFLTLLACSLSALAQAYDKKQSAYAHLYAVNVQWEGQQVDNNQSIAFDNDTERIAFHLEQVLNKLEQKQVANPSIKEKRGQLLRTLKVYKNTKEFPINTGHPRRTPYFIDNYGTACAVGHLIIESGHGDLALRIHEEHNFDYIAEIKTPGVEQWAEEHGFSLEELALIQPTYAPNNTLSTIGDGVNGTIRVMAPIFNDRLYIAGNFDELDGDIACSTGFGYIEDGIYYCVNEAPQGSISSINRGSNADIYVTGGFYEGFLLYPAAVHTDFGWELISVPMRPNSIGISLRYRTNPYERYTLALDPQDGTGNHEIWRYDANQDTWHLMITTHGPILCDTKGGYNDYFGGDFDSYTDHLQGDILMTCSGLLRLDVYSFMTDVAMPYSSDFMPDAITCLLEIGSVLYIGGTGDAIYPNTYLSRLQNESVQALIYRESDWGLGDLGLYDLAASFDGQDLYVAGDMDMGDFGTFGRNLGRYNLLNGALSPIAVLDAPVYALDSFDGTWYLGGEFTHNVGSPVNHFAKIGVASSLSELPAIESSASPNPVQGRLTIRTTSPLTGVASLRIIGLDGREHTLESVLRDGAMEVEASSLAAGIYLYQLETDEGYSTGKFVRD